MVTDEELTLAVVVGLSVALTFCTILHTRYTSDRAFVGIPLAVAAGATMLLGYLLVNIH